MRVIPLDTPEQVATWTAIYIANAIKQFQPTKSRPFVLGLPTGSTPVATYERLIELCHTDDLSFENVVTFNMDEYVGLSRNHLQSYWRFMHENLFDFVNIPPENIHMLNGEAVNLEAECLRFEQLIASYGGIRLFLGGVGHDGHVAFNEPQSSLRSLTRVKTLTLDTRVENAQQFFGGRLEEVPMQALTVGMQTLMDAEEVLLLAVGRRKALAVQAGVEGSVSHAWPVSALQMHRKCTLVCDDGSVEELRVKTLRYHKYLLNAVPS